MLATAGLLLGLMLYLFYLVGGVLTLAGFLVERATLPRPPAVESRADLSSMEGELLAFIDSVSLGGVTSIDEHALNRLTAAALTEADLPEEIAIHELSFDLEPARLAARITFTFRAGDSPAQGIRLRPLTGRIDAHFAAHPADDGILLTLQDLRIGRIRLPMRRVEEYLKSHNPAAPGLPFERVAALAYAIPYSVLAGPLPDALALESLTVARGALAARLRVDRRFEQALLAETTPLLREQGAALVAAVAAAFPEGQEELKEKVGRLASLGEPDALTPSQPSALVSYLENEVWASPPDGDTFAPEIGSDLFAGTQIETGEAALLEILLNDRSILKIGERTSFVLDVLPESGDGTPRGRFALLAGSVRGRIARLSAPDYEFATPSAVAGVRGTDLLLTLADERRLTLSVLEGSVALIPAAGAETLVNAGRRLNADRRELTRAGTSPLATEPLSTAQIEAIETEMDFVTSPADLEQIRESRRFWLTAQELKEVITGIIALEESERERLGRELEARLDPEAIDRRFKALMRNEEFAALITSFGIDGVPYP